jgi:hypothetical protein
MKRFMGMLLCFGILTCPTIVGATSFDVIVPSVIEIRTTGIMGIGIGGWGWIISTSDAISEGDFNAATFQGTIDDPNITISFDIINEFYLAPLLPGEVAGRRYAGINGSAYDPLLASTESLKDPNKDFYGLSISYPYNYTGNATLHASIMIGDDSVTYTSSLILGDFNSWKVNEGQRLNSAVIPEPATLLLLGSGLLGVAGVGRKLRKEQFRIFY